MELVEALIDTGVVVGLIATAVLWFKVKQSEI